MATREVPTLDGSGRIFEKHLPPHLAETAVASKAPKLDLVSKLPFKFYVSHRGGPRRYPEHSMEGYRASAAAGFLPEFDLQLLADGKTLVSVHDNTTGRTMTGSNVAPSTITRDDWLSRRILPAIPGGKTAVPVLWEDVLNEFGGRFVLVPEIKASGNAVVQAVIDSIKSRGLEKSVIVQSFDYTVCTTVAAAGIETLYLVGASAPQTAAEILANGIRFIGPGTGTTTAQMNAWATAGLKVIVYTVNDVGTATGAFAAGCVGVFTDDPWYLSGKFPTEVRDKFESLVAPVGHVPLTANGSTPKLVSRTDGTTRLELSNSSVTMLGQFGTISRGQKVTFRFRHMGAGIGTNSCRIYLHQSQTNTFTEAEQNWYLALFRRAGGVDVYEKAAGAIVLQTATAGNPGTFMPATADNTEGVDFQVEVELLATTIILRRLDTMASVTYPAPNVPGPFYISMGTLTAGASVQVFDVLVR